MKNIFRQISLVGHADVFQTPNRQFTLKELNGGTTYNLSVLAVNGAGNGMPAYSTTTTQAGGKREREGDRELSFLFSKNRGIILHMYL